MGSLSEWKIAVHIDQIKPRDEILLSTDGGTSGTIYDVVGVQGTGIEIKPKEIITDDGIVTLPLDRTASKIDFSIPAIKNMVYVNM